MNTSYYKLLKHILILCFSCDSLFLFAQEVDLQKGKNNYVYAEIFGNAPFISLNYERVIVSFEKARLLSRVGIGIASSYHIPLMLCANLRTGERSHLELGGGITLAYNYNNKTNEVYTYPKGNGITAIAAFRFQKPDQNSFVKFGWTPTYLYNDFYGLAVLNLFIYGISFGTNF